MKVRTKLKAGKLAANHSTSLCREGRGVKVRSAVRAGKLSANHNAALCQGRCGVRAQAC